MRLLDATDARADGGKLFFDAFVAAVDVIDAIDDGFALRDERGQDQRSAGAQIGCDYAGSGERCGTVDYGAASFDGDIRAHANHFTGVKKAIFEDRFGDRRIAFGLCCQRHELRLHVCGESGIFLGGDVGCDQLFCAANA